MALLLRMISDSSLVIRALPSIGRNDSILGLVSRPVPSLQPPWFDLRRFYGFGGRGDRYPSSVALLVLRWVDSSLAMDEWLECCIDSKPVKQNCYEGDGKLLMVMEVLSRPQPEPQGSPFAASSNNNNQKGTFSHFSKAPKLDFPRFSGDNPRSWICKCERFFQIHSTVDEQKTKITSLYLEGKVDSWFLDFLTGKTFIYWLVFVEAICNRFEDLENDNYVGCFKKLSQLTSVEEYFEQFEQLKALMLSKNPHLTEEYFILSFISGLKEVLKSSVQMHKPTTLSQSFFLARLQKVALASQQQPSNPISLKSPPTTSGFSRFSSSKPILPPSTFGASTSNTSAPPNTPPKTPYIPPIRRLSYEQMSKRRSQGLCFNCDDKYQPGHRCKSQQLFLMVADNEADEVEPSQVPMEEQFVDSDMEISCHALTGNANPDTIRIPGFIKKKAIIVLIDTGSTHSFIDSALATQLGCEVHPTAHMLVTVANGAKTTSTGIYQQLQWTMQQQQFFANLRLLSLGGCDIVLGSDWLRTLGDVTFNLAKLFISFIHNGQEITLQADIPTLVQEVLNTFSDVFEEPTQLPPPRILDHQIPLKPDSQAVNLRPYKCPYIHKKLNFIIIQDKLPITVIEEILDELHGLRIFTKLDLRADSLEYLGHIITSDGVVVDPEKIACMKSWPIPTTLKQLRGFLGLTGYYRKFVKGYGTISKPLTDLLKKNSLFWSSLDEEAFNTLKNAMCTTLVLALPDFTKQFVVETDACSRGVGSLLMQEGSVIAFYNKLLGSKALGLSTYEKELLAVVNTVTQ
ncbi:uncharacterized protein LOC113278901 [Papaver somniferum]|uniref:uncharacterized protein LOC113278901 n=1 Tax=Papaver somniferum TaxID=3469 RepID=UPI000E7041D0|nr:uncharacterized protein LOC113278901 [Papaver somniferum]